MTELLTQLALGFLIGGITVYAYMRKKGIDLASLLGDSILKNHLLKEELKKPSKSKNWKSSKKKYYGTKKKQGSTKAQD